MTSWMHDFYSAGQASFEIPACNRIDVFQEKESVFRSRDLGHNKALRSSSLGSGYMQTLLYLFDP